MTRYKPMTLLLSAAISALATVKPVVAGDGEWREYTQQPNGDVHFFDASRVTSAADQHQVWSRIRYKTSVMGAASYQSLVEIDCTERTERILQNTFFSDRDWESPAIGTDKTARPAQSIQTGSASEELFKLLCDQ